jgi:FixJ family two-component response regulator
VFGSAPEFLLGKLPDIAGCLVLDVRLPGLSGLDFKNELANVQYQRPYYFFTGHGDIPMSVRAMKAGAVEFLPKPFREQVLLDAVQIALECDRTRREAEKSKSKLRALFEAFSPREQEGMAFVTAGLMNKQMPRKLAQPRSP